MRDVKTGNKEVLQNLQKTNPELFTDDNKDLTYTNTYRKQSMHHNGIIEQYTLIESISDASIPTDEDIPADRETKISNERRT
jgi:hypothetical protein